MSAVHALSTGYEDGFTDSVLLSLLGFDPGSGHMGFVVDRVKLGQVFFEYFSFPYQFSFYKLLHNFLIILSYTLKFRRWQCRSVTKKKQRNENSTDNSE
jgi:hypothetical protein